MKEKQAHTESKIKFDGGQLLFLTFEEDGSPVISEQNSNVCVEISRSISARIFNFLAIGIYSVNKSHEVGTRMETFKTKYNDTIVICMSKSKCSILIDDEVDHVVLSGDPKEIRDFFKKIYIHFQ